MLSPRTFTSTFNQCTFTSTFTGTFDQYTFTSTLNLVIVATKSGNFGFYVSANGYGYDAALSSTCLTAVKRNLCAKMFMPCVPGEILKVTIMSNVRVSLY